jgi:hypothetical protein
MFSFPGHKRNADQNYIKIHLTPVRMAIFENTNTTNVSNQESMHTIGGNVN